MENNQFFAGVNVFVVRDGKLLLGKRKNVFGEGQWGLPGGHLEMGESITRAAARELKEETGLVARSFGFVNLVNDPQAAKHYVQIGFLADGVKGEPKLKEPERCYGWEWFDLNNLPENIFVSHQKQISAFRTNGQKFIDSNK